MAKSLKIPLNNRRSLFTGIIQTFCLQRRQKAALKWLLRQQWESNLIIGKKEAAICLLPCFTPNTITTTAIPLPLFSVLSWFIPTTQTTTQCPYGHPLTTQSHIKTSYHIEWKLSMTLGKTRNLPQILIRSWLFL